MWLSIVLVLASSTVLVEGQCSGTTTITEIAQVTALSECRIYDGDVVINPNSFWSLSIPGVSTITGDFHSNYGDELRILEVDDLVTVGQELSLRSNDALQSVSFASLRNVDELDLYGLHNLTDSGWNDDGGRLSNVTTVRIQGTSFSTLDWLTPTDVETITIEDNEYLNTINLPITSSSYTSIKSNGRNARVSLPNLRVAYNLTVHNCQEFSAPSLVYVNTSAGLHHNNFSKLSMPELLSLGSTLMLWNNSILTDLDLPMLTNVSGGIILGGNTDLDTLDLPRLSVVRGDILINDSLTSILMPSLSDVRGDVFVNSTSTLDCASLDPYDLSDVFKGQYRCLSQGTLPSESSPGTSSPGTSSPSEEASSDSGSSGSSLSGGAIAGIAVGVVGAVILIVAGGFLLWRRKKKQRRSMMDTNNTQDASIKDSPVRGGEKAPPSTAELDSSRTAKQQPTAEMPGEIGRPAAPELHGDSRPGTGVAELPGDDRQPRQELGPWR